MFSSRIYQSIILPFIKRDRSETHDFWGSLAHDDARSGTKGPFFYQVAFKLSHNKLKLAIRHARIEMHCSTTSRFVTTKLFPSAILFPTWEEHSNQRSPFITNHKHHMAPLSRKLWVCSTFFLGRPGFSKPTYSFSVLISGFKNTFFSILKTCFIPSMQV